MVDRRRRDEERRREAAEEKRQLAEEKRRRQQEEKERRLEERRQEEARIAAEREQRRLDEQRRRQQQEEEISRRRAETAQELLRVEEDRREAAEARLAAERAQLAREKQKLEEEKAARSQIENEAGGPVLVLINTRSGVSQVSRSQLKAIYLGQQTTWSNGTPVRAFNRRASSAAGKAFSRRVVGWGTYKKLWDSAPAALAGHQPVSISKADVMASRVAATPGAVGYVLESELTSTPAGVRVMRIK
jgi:chromosome segregation ATPase